MQHWPHSLVAGLHGIALQQRDSVLGLFQTHPLADSIIDGVNPGLNHGLHLRDVAGTADVAVARHQELRPQFLQAVQRCEPFVGNSLVQEGMHPVEDIVRREDHTLLGYVDGNLVRGVPGVIDEPEGVLADVER